MNRTKTAAAILSLALIGAVSVPTPAAGPVTSGYTFKETVPVISPYDPAVIEADTLSRAQLIAVLHEKEGKPVVNYAMDYTDVAPDAEYAEAVRWAASEQIACGYGDGKFGPDDPVTREQLAVILYRYAQKQGLGFSGNWAFPLDYSDADQISSYAYEPVCWLTMHGVLSDVGDDTFAPGRAVTETEGEEILELFEQVISGMEIANPFVDCETMAQAAQVAGFSLRLPDSVPNWNSDVSIRASQSGLIEVVCQGTKDSLVVRKAVGSGDISGDYSSYSEESTVEIAGIPVQIKGENGTVMVALWQDAGYTYAVRCTAGMELDQLAALLSDIG